MSDPAKNKPFVPVVDLRASAKAGEGTNRAQAQPPTRKSTRPKPVPAPARERYGWLFPYLLGMITGAAMFYAAMLLRAL